MKIQKAKIKDIVIGSGKPVFIAGPCVIEDYAMAVESAEFLQDFSKKKKIKAVFKLSYDKANRTSVSSYRGPGKEEGLKLIAKVRKKISMPVLVDIHCSCDAGEVAKVCDCIQIPAFLSRQTDILTAAGKTGKAVNIKKGQFLSPWAMKFQAEKVKAAGNENVFLTERGTAFGYGELVVDMRSIVIMRESGFPVVFDASHSQQKPPAGEKSSGGSREYVLPLSKAAIAAGADGIYCEIHPDPENAKSDADTQLSFKEFEVLVNEVSKM